MSIKSSFLSKEKTLPGGLMALAGAYCLSPWGSAAPALLLGLVIACTLGNPFADKTKIYAGKCLAWSVAGLGAGMNLLDVGKAGLMGLGLTIVSIPVTLVAGLALGRLLKAEADSSTLISVGTAICGGSAIAAVAPVIRAKPHSIAVALGAVFLLNALALVVFPPIGQTLHLTQHQFGIWSALAIHDTSSVLGAGLQYGPEALQTGTTLKLVRALWIVPMTLAFGFFRKEEDAVKTKKPWFILGFVIMAALATWVPGIAPAAHLVELTARRFLVLTLFLIGANLSLQNLKAVGIRPFVQAVVLWLLVSAVTLLAIRWL